MKYRGNFVIIGEKFCYFIRNDLKLLNQFIEILLLQLKYFELKIQTSANFNEKRTFNAEIGEILSILPLIYKHH